MSARGSGRASRRRRALGGAALTALLVLGLAGCGTDLSAGDNTVCYDAHESDAEAVYAHAPSARSEELLKLASPIKYGSSRAADELTMRKISSWCEDNGYDQKAERRHRQAAGVS